MGEGVGQRAMLVTMAPAPSRQGSGDTNWGPGFKLSARMIMIQVVSQTTLLKTKNNKTASKMALKLGCLSAVHCSLLRGHLLGVPIAVVALQLLV